MTKMCGETGEGLPEVLCHMTESEKDKRGGHRQKRYIPWNSMVPKGFGDHGAIGFLGKMTSWTLLRQRQLLDARLF